MFVDTHAHLFYENYSGKAGFPENEIDEVVQRASDASVDYILVPATDIPTAKKTIELTNKFNRIYGAAGVHPHDSKDWDESFIPRIEELAKHDKILAIGEIGLDYFYDFSPKEKQIKAFRDQIELALKLDLPIIVHNREADEDVMKIICEYAGSGLRAQFHCFNGSTEDALKLISMHHFISFTGNITFKNAESLRDTLSHIPLDNLLLETDSPFMTPVPYRGKRNEPAYVKYVAEQVAEVHKISIEEVARITSFNAFRLFGIGAKPETSYTYKIGNSLYINVTNRCNADCVFCKRKTDPVLKGYNLKMDKNEEPPADVYIDEIGNPAEYNEIVFCGFGEPTIRWNVVKEIARYVKNNNGRTRLDTNGHGNYINHRDITPEMHGLIDTVSISLNAGDAREYSKIMQVEPRMYNEMIFFAKQARNYVEKVVMSVVSFDEVEIEKARRVVEDKIGAEFRVREFFY